MYGRYGMKHLCARTGCGGTAVGAFVANLRDREAWLVDLESDLDGAVTLCRMHLDRFSVPTGWAISDERSAEQAPNGRRMAATEVPESIELPDSTVESSTDESPDPAESDPVAGPDRTPDPASATDETDPTDEPDEAEAATEPDGRWSGPARNDRLDILDAESPLLARAFGSDRPRRTAVFERSTGPTGTPPRSPAKTTTGDDEMNGDEDADPGPDGLLIQLPFPDLAGAPTSGDSTS